MVAMAIAVPAEYSTISHIKIITVLMNQKNDNKNR